MQLATGVFPLGTLPRPVPFHPHEGLQQSQKRVVKPAVPVVGGVHGPRLVELDDVLDDVLDVLVDSDELAPDREPLDVPVEPLEADVVAPLEPPELALPELVGAVLEAPMVPEA